MARPDLLRCIGYLSRFLTTWTTDCDRRLQQLMGYALGTLDHRLVGWVGDPPESIRLHLYTDADFAGCLKTSRSTHGVFLSLEGPTTTFPIG